MSAQQPIVAALSAPARRKRLIYCLIIVSLLCVSSFSLLTISPFGRPVHGVQYFRATVASVATRRSADNDNTQTIQAKLLDGPNKGHTASVIRSINFGDASAKRLPVGSRILLIKETADKNHYRYADRWHMPGVATLCLLLLALVVVVGGWRGITSVLGLAISIAVLSIDVLPQILAGQAPFATCIQGACLITIISIFVAHGFSRRTSVAFISSMVTLLVIIGLIGLATYLTGSSEVINEDTAGVLYSAHPVSLSGLLTGGIVIASLGVLYDITTGQAAAVDEIYKANTAQTARQLYHKGLSVGREHIAALVNTLALVYVGVALPSIVLTALYNNAPLLVVLNNETVVEEIVRTFVASASMLLAVPITTGLAAWLLPKWYAHPLFFVGSRLR